MDKNCVVLDSSHAQTQIVFPQNDVDAHIAYHSTIVDTQTSVTHENLAYGDPFKDNNDLCGI